MAQLYLPLQNMDCISRMYEIQKSLEIMRNSSMPIVFPMALLFGGVLPRWIGYSLNQLSSLIATSTQLNMIFASNFAIPKTLVDCNGHRILTMLGTSCEGGGGIHMVPVSCNGMMLVSLMGGENVLGSQENADCITNSIYEQIEKITSKCLE
jgi:hypothetical protein